MSETIKNYSVEEIVKAVLAALQPELQEPETLVPEVAVKTYKIFEDYPDVLQAKHVRAILGICEAKAYEVLNSKKCPSFTIGKRKLVRKEAFIQYLIDNDNQDLID